MHNFSGEGVAIPSKLEREHWEVLNNSLLFELYFMMMITTGKFSRPYGHLKSHVKVCCVTCTSEVCALDRGYTGLVLFKKSLFD